MITDDEITRAVEIIRAHRSAHRHGALRRTSCSTSRHKEALAQWKPGDPVDRELRALVVPGPELALIEVVVSVTHGRGARVARDRGMRPALLVQRGDERDLHHARAPRVHRRARPARDHRHRQRPDRPVARRRRSATTAETDRRIARCISFLRETPEDNGYARPIEGLIVHFDLGRNEVIEVIDHGPVVAARHSTRATTPRITSRCAPTSSRSRSPSRKGRASPSTATSSGGAVVVPHRLRPVRGADAAPGHLRRPRARAHRSCTARRSARWSCRTATRERCTAGRTRSTRASGVSAA